MAKAKGYRTLAGWKKAVTWGTPIAVGAGEQFEFNNESLAPDAQFIPDEQVSGERAQLEGDKGNEFHSGDVNMDFKYEGLETILAQAFGTAGAPVQEGTDDAYKHTFQVADELEGIFGTMVIYHKGFVVREYTTCKVGGFTFSSENGQRAKITFPMIPQGLNYNEASGTNNFTTAATLSLPTNRDFALFRQMKVYINDYDAIDFAAGDEVYVSSFEMATDNTLPTDDVTSQYGYLIDEPVCDGFDMVTGSINISKWSSLDRTAANITKARKKMKVEFTGPLADGTSYYSLVWWFPNIQFTTADHAVGGPQRVPENFEFKAHRTLVLPTGFPTGYVGPVTCDLINQNPLNALA